MKNYKKIGFLFVVACGNFLVANPFVRTRGLVIHALKRCKEYAFVEKIENTANEIVKMTESVLTQENLPGVAKSFENEVVPVVQGVKTDASQTTTASLFAKSTVETTNHYHTTHNYAKKTFAESFFEWLKNSGQKGSFSAGIVVGGVATYSLKKEQVVVIQAPVQGSFIK